MTRLSILVFMFSIKKILQLAPGLIQLRFVHLRLYFKLYTFLLSENGLDGRFRSEVWNQFSRGEKEEKNSRVTTTNRTYVRINSFPRLDTFWTLCSRRLLKTLWQKKKCFQLFPIIPLSVIEILRYFCLNVLKVVYCRFVVCGKVLTDVNNHN